MRMAMMMIVLSLTGSRLALAQDQHAGDIVVGITGPTAAQADTLAFEGDFDEPVFLNPVSGLFSGWTATEPGFEHLESDEPGEAFYRLGAGVLVRLEVVAIDSGLAVVQAGGGALADAPGESVLLGDDELHTHVTWYAQSAVLGGDWTGTLSATFRLIDAGSTQYQPSAPFTVTFTNVPEPMSAALLGGAWLLFSGRARWPLCRSKLRR